MEFHKPKMLIFTHPQKKMPVFVDPLMIMAIDPFIFHERVPAFEEGYEIPEDGEIDESKVVGAEDQFTFVGTRIHLSGKIEIMIRERPQTVRRRMQDAGYEFVG